MKRMELVVCAIIAVIAIAIRFYGFASVPPGLLADEAIYGTQSLFAHLQGFAVSMFGHTAWALHVIPALAGLGTILGVYVLMRRLFDDWRLAAIAAYFMSVGFWHIYASRIGLSIVLMPFFAVWGFYELYKGIETHRIWHWALAGAWFGLGFYTSTAYRILPLAILLVLAAYWLAIHAVFSHEKYAFARHQMLGGAAFMIGAMVLILLPALTYFYAEPISTVHSWSSLGTNALATLKLIFANRLVLFWPVAALCALGIVHTLWRLIRSWRFRKHPGVAHTLVLAWLIVGTLPALMIPEGSHDILAIILAAPPLAMCSAIGLHWLYLWMERWYHQSERKVAFAVVVLLLALGIADVSFYFAGWAHEEAVALQFNERSTQLAERIAELPPATYKYIVVKTASPQPLMFLTDTATREQQDAKNIHYLTEREFLRGQYRRGAVILQLDP